MADQERPRGRRERRSRRRQQREQVEAQRRRRYMIFGGVVGAVILFIAVLTAIELIGNGDDDADAFPPVQAAQFDHGDIESEPYFLGDPDAPVHLIEWSDYQWPGCGFFAREAKPQLVQDYVETGQVYLEYRDFAHLGEETVRAAEGAACAAEQDAYWDFNETLYANQETPPMNSGGYSDSRLIEMADTIGLDTDEFESCLDDGRYQDQVQDSTAEAQETGITSTPQFQINGRIVEWDSYEQLAAEIEADLNGD